MSTSIYSVSKPKWDLTPRPDIIIAVSYKVLLPDWK